MLITRASADFESYLADALAAGPGVSPLQDPVLAPMVEASPLFFAQTCLKGPRFSPFFGRLLFNEQHYAWEDIVTRNKRYVVLASRGSGKCMPAGSLIQQADGARIPIEDWSGGYVWALKSGDWTFEKAWSGPRFDNGVEEVLEIVTKTGRRTRVTLNHPLRTLNSWVPAKNLKVGDSIAAPRSLPPEAGLAVPDAYLIGYMLGDGSMTQKNLSFSCSDKALLLRLREEAKRKNWTVTSHKSNPTCFFFSQEKRWARPAPIRWAQNLGMAVRSAEKRVPACLFRSDLGSVWSFLSGFCETDVYIQEGQKQATLEFYSVSEGLLRDIQNLCVRVGLVTSLGLKNGRYKGERHVSWRLRVGSLSLKKLLGGLSLSGSNGEKVRRLRSNPASAHENSTNDLLPKEASGWLNNDNAWLLRNAGCRPVRGARLTRKKALKLAEAEKNKPLRLLAEAEVLWDPVVQINPLGPLQTYGLSVPGLENYVADDIVQHNSHFFSFICTLWRIATQPQRKGFLFGGTEYAAQRTLEEIRLELESNPHLQFLVPSGSSRRWTATQIRCSNGHSVTARGMLTRVRGAHPDYINCDDILTDEDGWSEVKRKRTDDYFYGTISNMIMPEGQLGVNGTPQAVRDTVMRLTNNPAYAVRIDPALDAAGNSTWPEVYSTEWLLAHRKEIGSVRFDREKMCRPVSDESSLFPLSLFYQGETMQPQARLGAPLSYWKDIGITEQYIGVDFAFSASVSADYFVIFVVGIDANENRWVLDMYREKGVSFSAQKAWIVTYGRRYEPRIIHLESNAAQQVAADELRRQTDLPIRKFVTSSAKHSLEDGLPSLRLLLENNKLRLPRGDARSVELTDLLVSEANNFTFIGGQARSVGGHDDSLMAWYIAEQAVRRGRRGGRLMVPSSTAAAPGRGVPPGPQLPRSGARAAPPAPAPGTREQPPLMPRTPAPGLPATRTVLRNGMYVQVDGA